MFSDKIGQLHIYFQFCPSFSPKDQGITNRRESSVVHNKKVHPPLQMEDWVFVMYKKTVLTKKKFIDPRNLKRLYKVYLPLKTMKRISRLEDHSTAHVLNMVVSRLVRIPGVEFLDKSVNKIHSERDFTILSVDMF